MNDEKIKEEILNLAKVALERGDVEDLIRESAKLAKKHPESYSRALAELTAPMVENMFDFMRNSPSDFQPQMVRTFWWITEVINRAKLKNWDYYSPFAYRSKSILSFDVKMFQGLLPEGALRIERDFSNIDQVLTFLLDALNSYKRRIAYICGMLAIIKGKEPDISDLVEKSPSHLERRINKGLGLGFLLGEEYRHLRNALAHGSYRIISGSHSIKFTDVKWMKEYDFAELVTTIQHAWNWMVGWDVAYDFQRLLTLKRLTIEPKSLRRIVALQ